MAKVPVVVHHIGPSCVQCNMTKRELDKLGVEYTEVDLRDHPELTEQFKQEGLLAAPIVTTDTKKWSGFRVDKIRSLALYIRSLEPRD
jgi:glutaredoxin-like protein NrdH